MQKLSVILVARWATVWYMSIDPLGPTTNCVVNFMHRIHLTQLPVIKQYINDYFQIRRPNRKLNMQVKHLSSSGQFIVLLKTVQPKISLSISRNQPKSAEIR